PELRDHVVRRHSRAVEVRGTDERIVWWHAVICLVLRVAMHRRMVVWFQTAGQLVNIDAENTAEVISVNALTVVKLVCSISFISQRNVEIAVGAKLQLPCVVVV